MEWIERLNQAVDYMEGHLEGEIDYGEAARLACCSVFHFQRMFSYMAGIPVSEYVRRRRMTLAALELQEGSARVLDLALKYGYQSPTAFNRAFQSIHGFPPSEARKQGVQLKAYPPISFQITVLGAEKMEYRIEQKEAFRVVGYRTPLEKEIEKNFSTTPRFWGKVSQEGGLERLLPKMDGNCPGVLGLSACFGDDDWSYYIAVASGEPADEGMEEYRVPASLWAVFSGEGPMPEAVQQLEKRMVTEWLPSSGYEYGDAPDIELYLNADPANARFEIWLPVVKK